MNKSMEFDEQIDQDNNNNNKRNNIIVKKWQSMSISKKRQFIIKMILFIICATLLVYHSYLLFEQYFRGKTVVSIQMERIRPDSMPAITICYPQALRMDNMGRYYPEIRAKYTEYKSIIDRVNDKDYENATLKQYLVKLYDNFTDFYNKKRLPLNDLFDGPISIPFDLKSSPTTRAYRPGALDMANDNTKNDKNNFLINLRLYGISNGSLLQKQDTEPIVSIVADNFKQIRKCFTFYSELNPKYRRFEVNLYEISLNLHHNKYWFPPNLWDLPNNKIHLSLHSANVTPYDLRSENFLNLKMNHEYEVVYSTIKTIRLKPNYETMCREYIPDSDDGNRTRADCRYKCFEQQMLNKKGCCRDSHNNAQVCRNCSLWSTNLIQRHFGYNTTLCEYNIDDRCGLIADDLCYDRCHKSCYVNLYGVEIKDKNKLEENPWDKRLILYLSHNPLLDQTVEHSPEMTSITFLSNMGGLIGIWLGLAVFTLLELLIKML